MEEKRPSSPVSFITYRTPRSSIAFLVVILSPAALLLALGFASGTWPVPDAFLTAILVLQLLFVIVIGALLTQRGVRSFGMKLVHPFSLYSPASTLVMGFFSSLTWWAVSIMFQREEAYDVAWVAFFFVGGQLGAWTWRLLRRKRARERGDADFSVTEGGFTLAQAVLFLLPLVTWVPAAFLIEWLGVPQLIGVLLWLGYVGVSLFVWDRYLLRRQASARPPKLVSAGRELVLPLHESGSARI